MGKRSRENADDSAKAPKAQKSASKPVLVEEKAVDPTLALLFASSVSIKHFCYSYEQEIVLLMLFSIFIHLRIN